MDILTTIQLLACSRWMLKSHCEDGYWVGDQLAIAKETGRRLGMETNMYPSSSLLGQDKDASITALPVDELIEKADGFVGVFSEHKYEIVKKFQERKHICGMAGERVNDAPTLKKADIGTVVDTPDAARGASDIILMERQSLIKGILSRARGRLLITSPSPIYAVQCGLQWPEQLLLRCITSTLLI